MIVRIVPLPSHPDYLKFDIILPEGYAKQVLMDSYELKAYRGASITSIIEQKVLDLLQEMGHTTDSISIQFL